MRKTVASTITSLAARLATSGRTKNPSPIIPDPSFPPLRRLLPTLPPLLPSSSPSLLQLSSEPHASSSSPSSSSSLQALLVAAGVGVGAIETCFADASEDGRQDAASTESSPSEDRTESLAAQERRRLEELLRSRDMQRGSYPSYTVSTRGQKRKPSPTTENQQQHNPKRRKNTPFHPRTMRKTVASTITSLAARLATSGRTKNPSPIIPDPSFPPLRRLLPTLPPLLPSSSPSLLQLSSEPHASSSSPSSSSSLQALLVAAGVGVGAIETCFADASEDGRQDAASTESSPSEDRTESLAAQERRRLEELLRSRDMQRGSYPSYTVSTRGQKVTIKFKIPPTCEISHIIIDLVSHLGSKAETPNGGSEMILRAWDSAAAWQLTLKPLEKMKEAAGEVPSKEMDKHEGDFCILIFESLVGSEYSEVEFIKQGSFSFEELNSMASALRIAGRRDVKKLGKDQKGLKRDNKHNESSIEKSISALEAMGVRVYGLDETCGVPSDGCISWDNIAGYDQQKREIEDTVLLALQNPEIYDDIARGTRCKYESNRPRAVLFEGPPGTGKTSSARVIAKQAGVPLLYVPLEVIMSKYFGESERLLGTVFSLANDLPKGAIVFLDEVDSFAVARDSEMHEATRRILSVLLRQIDGFEQEKQVIVIAATNRKQDLDPALISRFDSIIYFDLPEQQTREEIVAQYAKHLNKAELVQFASETKGMSGRDIRDVCQQAERKWASKLIRGLVTKDDGDVKLPPVEEYIQCAEYRREALLDTSDRSERSGRWKPAALA